MSIIQNIRDKYARVAVVAIALALIGFILTDYIAGRNRSRGSGRSNSVGSINGHTVNIDEFSKVVDQAEAGLKQQYGDNPAVKQQALEQAWNQQINLFLLTDELDKLGMQIGNKEKGDVLYGPNAPDDIKKAGMDDNGNYDPIRAKQQVDQMMKSNKTPQEQKDNFNTYIDELERQRKIEKYFSLFSNSINYPRWLLEKQNADNSLIAKISLVKEFYTDSTFVDSTIKISDKEIADYVSKHKDDFKQEASRSISYVTFSATPTLADTAAVKNQIISLKPEFDTTKDVSMFLARNGGTEPQDVYLNPSQLPRVAKDSILKLPKNGVYGPYLDGGSYSLAKVMDLKVMPDSVKARHILIETYDPTKQQQILPDSVGQRRIDSIEKAIKAGARFDSMAVKFSDDKSSAIKGGLLESPAYQGGPNLPYFTPGTMVKEFNDFCFDGKTGDRKVVKTIFGYHLIEILDQKNFEPHCKVAYLSQQIASSKETDDSAQAAADNFFAATKDQKTFDATFEKTLKPKGITKGTGTNIKEVDGMVMPLGYSRQFVRDIYAAKQGEVLKPEKVGDNYVVAIVTEVLDEGTVSVAKARPAAEVELRKRKKAEMLKQKIGKITTLEAAATALNKQIETVDSLRMTSGSPHSNFGNEPKVNGATFNPANKGKVVTEVLEGKNGVYVIRVENVSATAITGANVADQRKEMYQRGKQMAGNPLEALKNAASIKDKRADKY